MKRIFLLLLVLSLFITPVFAAKRFIWRTAFTGGVNSVDTIDVSALDDGSLCVVSVNDKIYYYSYDSNELTDEDANNPPNIIEPDIGNGAWVLLDGEPLFTGSDAFSYTETPPADNKLYYRSNGAWQEADLVTRVTAELNESPLRSYQVAGYSQSGNCVAEDDTPEVTTTLVSLNTLANAITAAGGDPNVNLAWRCIEKPTNFAAGGVKGLIESYAVAGGFTSSGGVFLTGDTEIIESYAVNGGFTVVSTHSYFTGTPGTVETYTIGGGFVVVVPVQFTGTPGFSELYDVDGGVTFIAAPTETPVDITSFAGADTYKQDPWGSIATNNADTVDQVSTGETTKSVGVYASTSAISDNSDSNHYFASFNVPNTTAATVSTTATTQIQLTLSGTDNGGCSGTITLHAFQDVDGVIATTQHAATTLVGSFTASNGLNTITLGDGFDTVAQNAMNNGNHLVIMARFSAEAGAYPGSECWHATSINTHLASSGKPRLQFSYTD